MGEQVKVIMLKGLAACGKTTYARELCLADRDFVRVNKDDIRREFATHGVEWSHANEKTYILPERDYRILKALGEGRSVIVDDTNLAPKHEARLRELAKIHGASFEVHNFNVPLEECVARDAARPEAERVGEHVIRGMAMQFLGAARPKAEAAVPSRQPLARTPGLQNAIICDLDGTLALSEGKRGPYDHAKCGDDDLNHPVASILETYELMNSLAGMFGTLASLPLVGDFCKGLGLPGNTDVLATQIIFLSGREDKFRPQTNVFLQKNCPTIANNPLFMRATGDKREDSIVKSELFDAHVRGKFNVLFVLDDRNRVVDMWRRIGLTCLQVQPGDF